MFAQVLDLTVDVHVISSDLSRVISEGPNNQPLQYTYEASKVRKDHDALLFSLLPPALGLDDKAFEEAPPLPPDSGDSLSGVLDMKALETTNGDGRSLFHLAAICGTNRELALLLRHPQAHLLANARDAYGATALTYAAFAYNTEAVRMLLDVNADPTLRDAAGNCARDWAVQRGHFFARETEAQMLSLLNVASIDEPHLVVPISSWMPHLPLPPSHTPSLRSSTSSVASTPRSVGSVASSSVRSGTASSTASVQLDAGELADYFNAMGVHEAVELSDPKRDVHLSSMSAYLDALGATPGRPEMLIASPTPLVAAPLILPPVPTPPPPPPSPPQRVPTLDPHLAGLDQMLRQLASNSSSETTTPASSPPTGRHAAAAASLQVSCGACKEPVSGRAVTALGKTYHPNHFVCLGCAMPLGTSSFFEHDSQPFCSSCYWQRFGRPCHQCALPIRDGRSIAWQQRTYEPRTDLSRYSLAFSLHLFTYLHVGTIRNTLSALGVAVCWLGAL
jgi:hypothetical protein